MNMSHSAGDRISAVVPLWLMSVVHPVVFVVSPPNMTDEVRKSWNEDSLVVSSHSQADPIDLCPCLSCCRYYRGIMSIRGKRYSDSCIVDMRSQSFLLDLDRPCCVNGSRLATRSFGDSQTRSLDSSSGISRTTQHIALAKLSRICNTEQVHSKQ